MGVNCTWAQVHALLYLSAEPVTAEDIAEALSVARSTVSAWLPSRRKAKGKK